MSSFFVDRCGVIGIISETGQMEFEFGEDFKYKKSEEKPILAISGPVVDFCCLCRDNEPLTAAIPIGLDGMYHIASPYSDFICHVCIECYNRWDGDEVWKLYYLKKSIQEDIEKSRFSATRRVITEKKWQYIGVDGFVSPFPKKSK
jgi:hypothetical protein